MNTEAFYNTIADKYHWFFSSWDKITESQMNVICPVLKKYDVKTVLDCSCGSGKQAVALAKRGYKVDASDISQEMVTKASQFADEEGVKICFHKADFRELKKHFKGEYDAVLSWGNSIPHLMNDSDLEKALSNIYLCVKKGGIVLFSMRNYDVMLQEKKRFHPMRINDIKDDKRYSIVYVFDYLEDKIRFNILYIIEDLKTGVKHMESESVDYNPIKREHFILLLKKIGFRNISFTDDGRNICYFAEK